MAPNPEAWGAVIRADAMTNFSFGMWNEVSAIGIRDMSGSPAVVKALVNVTRGEASHWPSCVWNERITWWFLGRTTSVSFVTISPRRRFG